LVDTLFERPAISVNRYTKVFGVTYPTARSDLRKVEMLGILQPLEPMELISYYCRQIYEITYEDLD
jgi:Fic family protein